MRKGNWFGDSPLPTPPAFRSVLGRRQRQRHSSKPKRGGGDGHGGQSGTTLDSASLQIAVLAHSLTHPWRSPPPTTASCPSPPPPPPPVPRRGGTCASAPRDLCPDPAPGGEQSDPRGVRSSAVVLCSSLSDVARDSRGIESPC